MEMNERGIFKAKSFHHRALGEDAPLLPFIVSVFLCDLLNTSKEECHGGELQCHEERE